MNGSGADARLDRGVLEPAIGAAYMAAKAGAARLMRNAALELTKYNIRANAIAPGFFLTSIGDG